MRRTKKADAAATFDGCGYVGLLFIQPPGDAGLLLNQSVNTLYESHYSSTVRLYSRRQLRSWLD